MPTQLLSRALPTWACLHQHRKHGHEYMAMPSILLSYALHVLECHGAANRDGFFVTQIIKAYQEPVIARCGTLQPPIQTKEIAVQILRDHPVIFYLLPGNLPDPYGIEPRPVFYEVSFPTQSDGNFCLYGDRMIVFIQRNNAKQIAVRSRRGAKIPPGTNINQQQFRHGIVLRGLRRLAETFSDLVNRPASEKIVLGQSVYRRRQGVRSLLRRHFTGGAGPSQKQYYQKNLTSTSSRVIGWYGVKALIQ